MDPAAFSSNSRGKVVRAPEGCWSFHPHKLPRQVDLTPRLLMLLEDATGAVHRLGGVGLLLPNPNLLIAPHLRIEAVQSSRIEGTQTDIPGLLRFEAGDRLRDVEVADATEVSNYVNALSFGLDQLGTGFPVSMRLFRDMHGRLLQGVRGEYQRPGELRSSPVWIGGSTLDNAVFVPPPVDVMKDALDDLELFLHQRELPLLVTLALAHYQFEVIHPFLDGNGRLGRLLIPLLLSERSVLPQPLLYLSAYFERNRQAYYDHLLYTSQRGDLDDWLEFFLVGVAEQARDAEARTVRIVSHQAQLREELLADKCPTNVVRLAESLFSRPITDASRVAAALEITAATANSAIKVLVERGELREITGRQRGRIFEAPRILDAVYGDIDQA